MVPKSCSAPECTKAHFSSGLCGTHYRAAKPPCTFEGCAKPRHAKGYCGQHYRRVQRYGDVNATATIVGNDTARFWSYVEKTATCWNWTGDKHEDGYGNLKVAGHEKKAHRLSYEWLVAPIPPGKQLDHMCHNKACVNPEHLRLATQKQNSENLPGPRRNNKSGALGVSWNKKNRNWRARVGHNGKDYDAGSFADLNEARSAAIAKRLELFTYNLLDRIPA